MFRGAQSTVQGRNAMAGTLVVKTKDPTFDPEAKVRFTVGNFGSRQVSGAVSGALVDGKIAGRTAFDRQTSDTFVEGFEGYQGVDNPGDFETLTARPFGDHQSSYPLQPVFEPRTTSVVAETRWAFNGQTAYEHTLAFTNVEVERKAVPGDGNALIDGREFVFEPRVHLGVRRAQRGCDRHLRQRVRRDLARDAVA